jgi:hypothetical protein
MTCFVLIFMLRKANGPKRSGPSKGGEMKEKEPDQGHFLIITTKR